MQQYRVKLALVIAGAAGLASALSAQAQTIYFADIFVPSFADGSIRRVNVDGSGLQTVLDTGGGLRSIDVDAAGGKVYFCDVDNYKVARCNTDGSGVQDLATGLAFPATCRLNRPEGLVVWGDQTDETISRANLDGTGSLLITTTPFHRGLVIDPAAGYMYWDTSITPTSGRIMRSNLDGTGQVILVNGATFGKPASLAIDAAAGKLYWTDYVNKVVRRSNFDGSGLQTLYSSGDSPRAIALDLPSGKLYWGQDYGEEPTFGAIYRSNLDGSGIEFFLTGLGLVNDMVIVASGPAPCYANCDASTAPPVLNVQDFSCFLGKFASDDPYANCDGSTQPPVLNVQDFSCFLGKFAAGCP
jgi:hypothetical protein